MHICVYLYTHTDEYICMYIYVCEYYKLPALVIRQWIRCCLFPAPFIHCVHEDGIIQSSMKLHSHQFQEVIN